MLDKTGLLRFRCNHDLNLRDGNCNACQYETQSQQKVSFESPWKTHFSTFSFILNEWLRLGGTDSSMLLDILETSGKCTWPTSSCLGSKTLWRPVNDQFSRTATLEMQPSRLHAQSVEQLAYKEAWSHINTGNAAIRHALYRRWSENTPFNDVVCGDGG